jgi:hypothetical protein
VVVRASGGRTLEASADTGIPATDLDRQWEALSAKFFALATPVVSRERVQALHDAVACIDSASSVRDILALTRPDASP